VIEYKILTGTQDACQKTLNQWKHDYTLTIISMTYDAKHGIAILLTRILKDQ
jgi:hypothetical protein